MMDDKATCPCGTEDEPDGHLLMVSRETRMDYALRAFADLPDHDAIAELLIPDGGLELQAEAADPAGPGTWTVTCERRCEEGETTQAMWLRDALAMWIARFPSATKTVREAAV